MEQWKEIYEMLKLPALAPPAALFGVVWPILYGLMGVSLYLVLQKPRVERGRALLLFFVQLGLNLLWPFLFFGVGNYAAALGILFMLWVAIVMMIQEFYTVKPLAAYLQIPYLLWVSFALYLNFYIFYHN